MTQMVASLSLSQWLMRESLMLAWKSIPGLQPSLVVSLVGLLVLVVVVVLFDVVDGLLPRLRASCSDVSTLIAVVAARSSLLIRLHLRTFGRVRIAVVGVVSVVWRVESAFRVVERALVRPSSRLETAETALRAVVGLARTEGDR